MSYTDEELLKACRDDAFHGAIVAVSLPQDHPMRTILKNRFEIILEAIDAHSRGDATSIKLGDMSGGSAGDGGSGGTGTLGAGMAPQ